MNCFMHGPELLVPAHKLHLPSLNLIKQDEVSYDIDEIMLSQRTGNKDLLAVQILFSQAL